MKPTYRFIILVSANSEWKSVLDCLHPERIGSTPFGSAFPAQAGRHQMLFAHGGWGKTASAAACQHLIDLYHPQLIVNLGTCGGLEGYANVGEILLVEETAMYDIVEGMSDYAAAIEHYRTLADQDIQTQNVDLIANVFQAPAADWESAAIAWTAAKNKTPWLVLRGVSDLVSKEKAEAYHNVELWRERTNQIMADLLAVLPWFLDCFSAQMISD